MDSNSKRRMKWNQDEMERRRTDRARQRSEIMNQRRQAAQTQYMDRMARRAGEQGATANAQGAIAYGESRGEYADRRQGYMTADAQRKLAASQGYAARTTADAQMRDASANYLGVQQRPGLQKAAIEGDLGKQRLVNEGAMGVARINDGTQRYVANRESWGRSQDAATLADAQGYVADRQARTLENQPILTESGVVRRTPTGEYTMDAFPGVDPYEAAEADYQQSSAIGKVWKDPIRALIPFYDPRVDER